MKISRCSTLKSTSQVPKQSSLVNDSTFYQIVLPRLVRILRRWRPQLAPRVLLLSPNHIVKYGPCMTSEAYAMEFVSKNTTIPLPRIITAFPDKKGNCYILMTRCPGVPLCNAYLTMSMEGKIMYCFSCVGSSTSFVQSSPQTRADRLD